MPAGQSRCARCGSALLFDPDPDGWARETSEISSGRGFGIRHKIAYPVFQRHRKRGLRAMSVNPAFVYGRGGWFEEGVLKPMRRGQSKVIGEGTQTMHYIEASDAASGYRLRALLVEIAAGEAFRAGAPPEVTP